MANDGKIYITISDTRNGSGGGVSPDVPNQPQSDKDKGSNLADFAKHKFFNFIQSEAKQFVNFSVNNIGNFTGNYQAQRDAQANLEAAGFLINLGTSIAAGAKMGGGWGALIAGTITIASKAISIGYSAYADDFNNRKINRNMEYMRMRLGLDGLTDGSRTGGQ